MEIRILDQMNLLSLEEASTMLGRLIIDESSYQDDVTLSYTDIPLVSDFAKEYIKFFHQELIEGYYDKTLFRSALKQS